MKTLLSIAALLLVFHNAKGQTPNTPENLRFHSNFEKTAFSRPVTDASNTLALLIALNPKSDSILLKTVNGRIQKLFKNLEEEGIREKKIKKSAKIIFEKVHKDLLVQYREYAEFQEIFENGTYNCVTASAIYALVFEHFAIPYEIRQMPGHVYVVMDPAQEHIVIESTDPVGGVFKTNKEKYVRLLAESKMIPANEVQSSSTDALFEKYVASDETKIDLRQLVGDLYFNKALSQFEADSLRNAYHEIEKSLVLFDREMAQNTQKIILLKMLSSLSDEDPESFFPYFKLLENKVAREEIQNDLVRNFANISEKYLITENQPDRYEAFHQYFLQHLPESEEKIRKSLQRVHHLQYTQRAQYSQDIDLMLAHLDSAYTLFPNDLQIQSFISQSVFIKLGNEYNRMGEFEKYLPILTPFLAKYPFLIQNPKVINIQFWGLAGEAGQFFSDEKTAEGFEKLKELEEKYAQLKDKTSETKLMMGMVYHEIAAHYVRQNQNDTGRQWLKKGLEIVPDSNELKRMEEAFDDDTERYETKPVRKKRN